MRIVTLREYWNIVRLLALIDCDNNPIAYMVAERPDEGEAISDLTAFANLNHAEVVYENVVDYWKDELSDLIDGEFEETIYQYDKNWKHRGIFNRV